MDAEITPDTGSNENFSGYQRICDRFEEVITKKTSVLSDQDRCIAGISAAFASRRWNRLETLAGHAVRLGLAGEAVAELCLQTTIYVGVADFPKVIQSVTEGLAQEGVVLQFSEQPHENADCEADRIRQHLHGARHQNGHADPNNGFSGPLYEMVAKHGYGLIWTRPGLELRQRLTCAIAALSITGPDPVLSKFVLTSRDHGMSDEMLREIVMQTVIYQGSPRTLHALMAVEKTISAV